MPELILRSGKRAGRRIALPAGEVIIGRDEVCRIRLTSSDVSRQHCRIRCNEQQVMVADLGSRNGTFLNERRVTTATLLKPGDLLRVGPFIFQMPGLEEPRDLEKDITGWLTVEGGTATTPYQESKNDTTLVSQISDEEGHGVPVSSVEGTRTLDQMAISDQVNQRDPIIQQASEVIQDYWRQKVADRR